MQIDDLSDAPPMPFKLEPPETVEELRSLLRIVNGNDSFTEMALYLHDTDPLRIRKIQDTEFALRQYVDATKDTGQLSRERIQKAAEILEGFGALKGSVPQQTVAGRLSAMISDIGKRLGFAQ